MLNHYCHRSLIIPATGLTAVAIGTYYALNADLLHFPQIDSAALADWFTREAGRNPWTAYALYYAFFTMVLCLSLPMVTASILAAGAVFSYTEAIVLVTLCRMSAAWLGFGLTRTLLSCAQRALQSPWCRTLQRRIEQDGVKYLLILRVMPLLPDSVVNYGMGLTRMGWIPYTLVSFLGMLPLTLGTVYLGNEINAWMAHLPWDYFMPPLETLLMAGVCAAFLLLAMRFFLKPVERHVWIERRRPYAPYSFKY